MSLSGKVICFTGALSTMKRAEASQKAIAAGATVASSVTKKVNILVVGGGGEYTNKSCDGYDLKQWTEAEFIKSLGSKKAAAAAPVAAKKAPATKAAPKPAASKASSGSLSGKVICFTGALSTMKRAEATQKAIAAGAEVAGSVTKKVNVLVVGGGADSTNKSWSSGSGVEQWSEAEFIKKLGSSAASAPVAAKKAPATKAAPKPAAVAATGGSLSGKVICFTGALSTMKRAEASQKAIAAGAEVAGTVTKKVNVLVVGGGADNTNKSWSGSGVEQWSEADFIKHLSGSKARKAPGKTKQDDEADGAPAAKRAAKK